METKMLTVKEAAKILNIGRTKTYELIRTRAIPSIHFGKTVRVPEAALKRFIEKNTHLP